ncbi:MULTISPECIES: putative polysaccharide biosynthesis protein [Clostridium]|uniref:putative polysaccharide biosynthesis protein n=1 Tax=Clostridium TaxID=1485 RepID=UPI000825A1AA|nr:MULTISPECIES: polysaccharide biosynthesis protein [Clostridium]PJI07313.1 polysaccharide biosynthesis protein [Clostridium sp. CT7]
MKKQSTSKGFAVLSMGTIVSKLLSLLYVPLLTKILGGSTSVGIYSVSYQIYAFVYVLTNAGVPVAISKLVSEFVATKNYKDANKSFKMCRAILITLGLVMGLIMFVFAKYIAVAMKFPQAKLSVMALSPAILFTSISSTYRGYFQGNGNMVPTAVSQVLEQFFNTIFSLAFAALLLKNGVEQACAGATVGTTLGAFVSALYLIITYGMDRRNGIGRTNPEGVRRRSSRAILNRIANYAFPITVCIGMQNLGNLLDTTNTKARLLIAGIQDYKATGLVGSLAQYQTLINVPIAVLSALAVAILPAISAAVAVRDRKKVAGKINYAFRLCFVIAIPSAVGLSILSKPIYKFIYSNSLSGYKIMLMGAEVLIFMCLLQVQTSILQGAGKLYSVTLYSIIGIVVKISTNYILVANSKINIYGTIIGSILGFSTTILLNYLLMKKSMHHVKFHMFRFIKKPLFASIFMGGAAYGVYYILNFSIGYVLKVQYLVNLIALMVAMLAAVVVYGIVLVFIGGIRKRDMESMPSKLKRHIPNRIMNMMRE